jgi:ABC-type Fe3+-hydroxamate transport system substrate-binding protein
VAGTTGNRAIIGGRLPSLISVWHAGKTENKMKGNTMKALLAIICSAILIVACAQAQTSTTSSRTTSNPSTTSNTSNTTTTSTNGSSGTVTDYTPGAAITLDPGTGKPVHFVIGDKIQVIGPDGKVLANTAVKKNAKVHVRLIQEGDRTVVDQINVDSE